jgi:hypothetical protein
MSGMHAAMGVDIEPGSQTVGSPDKNGGEGMIPPGPEIRDYRLLKIKHN